MSQQTDRLGMWVIYAPGTDGNRQYTARWWWADPEGAKPTDITQTSYDLETLRESYTEAGFFCIPRSETDPFNVVETWL